MNVPTGRAEELRRRSLAGGLPGLNNRALKELAREAIDYAAELERQLELARAELAARGPEGDRRR